MERGEWRIIVEKLRFSALKLNRKPSGFQLSTLHSQLSTIKRVVFMKKTVLITGASGGIGSEIARKFAKLD